MPRTSVQDLVLQEMREMREENRATKELLARIDERTESIKDQTQKTNGRVGKLEERANIQRGGLYVAYVAIVLVIVPLLVAWIKHNG